MLFSKNILANSFPANASAIMFKWSDSLAGDENGCNGSWRSEVVWSIWCPGSL